MIPLESPSRSPQPLYRQVEMYLREQITSGTLQSGDMLPSVKDLCDQFGGINHLTVRQAIKNLSEENLVKSVQGRGCFVTENTQRVQRIAIVLPHLEDTIFVRIARGAQEVLESEGVRSLILDSRGSHQTEAEHLNHFGALPVGGAIIFPIASGNVAEQVFKLKVAEFPFVLVDRYFEDIASPCVVADNYQGGYDSAKYLVERGRLRVAWVGEWRSTPARLRLQGFQAALNDAGVPCPSALIKNVETLPSAAARYHTAARGGVFRAVDELLDQTPAIDGLVCCDDASALSALVRLKERGREVPGDVALIGFDDVPEAGFAGLTTVRQPMLEMGEQAARLLLERVREPEGAVRRVVLPVELVKRETA